MIDQLSAVAKRLNVVRPVFGLFGIAAAGVAAFEIFGGGLGQKDYLAVALIALLWSVLGFAAIGLFQSVPSASGAPYSNSSRKGGGGFVRALRRGFFYLLAGAFVIVSVVGLYMTYKLLSLGG